MPTRDETTLQGGVYNPRNEAAKPPLGLEPQSCWDRKRLKNVISAMDRYNDAGKEIPAEWFTELYQLAERI